MHKCPFQFYFVQRDQFYINIPWREAGDVWCLYPVWNLRAVMWFHFTISSLVFLLSPVTLSVLSSSFSCLLGHSPELFPENSSIFFIKRQAFLHCSCLVARRSKLVSGMCNMLPYGTGICCYAFIYYCKFLIASVHHLLKNAFFKSGIDKLMEWSMIPACPSLLCFFNRGNMEGTNSLKSLHSGKLQTQKLKPHLVRTQSLNVLPLKPGVGQYI